MLRKLSFALAGLLWSTLVIAQPGCRKATIQEPQPFLGTAEEIIVLSDGTVRKDLSYKYLYLYAYSPMVVICPQLGTMTLDNGGTKHVFSVVRVGR